MPVYKLIYFNARGRAELIRLIFAQAGVEYEDKRVNREEWAPIKPNTPWGVVPVLEVDGKMLGQSFSIARYVARQHGLGGKTPIEDSLADSVVDSLWEIMQSFIKVRFEKDEDKKVTWADIMLYNILDKLENMAKISEPFIKYPKLDVLAKKVGELPNIKTYVENRPKTDF